KEREISIPEKLTPRQVRDRAEVLPEPSLDMIFTRDRDLSQGETSKLFTVRTIEKSSQLVSASVNRLLGDMLKKNDMRACTVDSAILVFPGPTDPSRVRGDVVSALREGGVIGPESAASKAAAVAAKLAPLGGGTLAAAAALANPTAGDVVLKGQEFDQ